MFRTEIQLTPSPANLNIRHKILTAGSCFSDAIGTQLLRHKFPVQVNPFGTVYNPYSIHKLIRYAIHNQPTPEHAYLNNQDVWSNYDFHSGFSALKKTEVQKKIQDTIGATHYFLKNASWILITYGTAWAYERNDTGEIVANCHKLPASNFTKHLLSQKKVLESFNELYSDLKNFNPECKIILTVSPVRHIKDSLPLNSVSKSVLRLACQTIAEEYEDVHYFPAFEIMVDDLRDYRFYRSDMIHPTEEAEKYIWTKFSACFMDDITTAFIKKWEPIHAALQHKAFHPASQAHQNFLRNTLVLLEELQGTVDLTEEINTVKSKII